MITRPLPSLLIALPCLLSLLAASAPFAASNDKTLGENFKSKLPLFYSALYDQARRCPRKVHLYLDRKSLTATFLMEIRRIHAAAALTCPVHCQFKDEMAYDAGGVTREAFGLLAKEIFDPDKQPYFRYSPNHDGRLEVSPKDFGEATACKGWEFNLIGSIIGMAIAHKIPLGVRFVPSVYKAILRQKPAFEDLEGADRVLHQGLLKLKECDLDSLALTFTAPDPSTASGEVHLVEDGGRRAVTRGNLEDYLERMAESRLVSYNLWDLAYGLWAVLRPDILDVFFSPEELECLIAGETEVDVQDWRANATYYDCSADHTVVKWFWGVVENVLDNGQRGMLLKFATGCSQPPLTGFRNLPGGKFTIAFNGGLADHLPVAHTCFNRVDLSDYSSEAALQQKLLMAINEAQEMHLR